MEEEDNISLMKEVTEGELKEVLQSFQKDKILGLDGWTIEFFIDLFELLGGDLLRVVEDTRISGSIPANFNSTFIASIPKVDNHVSLNDFGPISLGNYIYKVVSNVIAQRPKGILFEHISNEQIWVFGGKKNT